MKKAFKYLLNYIGLSIVGAIVFAIPGFILAFALGASTDEASMMNNPWLMSIIIIGSQLAPLYFFWKQKWSDYTFFKVPNVMKMLLWIVLGWLGLWMIELFTQEYTPFAEWDIDTLEEIAAMIKTPLGFISCCILAPIIEEGVFRGAIERKLLERNWNPWWAIVISALIFSIAHFNMTQGIAAFLMGLLFGWIYYRTRNIWLCVFGHALNNTIASVLSFIGYDDFGSIEKVGQGPSSLLYFIPILVVGISLFVKSMYLIDRQQKKNDLLAPAPVNIDPVPANEENVPPVPPMSNDNAPQSIDDSPVDAE